MNLPKVMEYPFWDIENNEEKETIDSREIAVMVKKEHKRLVAEIDDYIKQMIKASNSGFDMNGQILQKNSFCSDMYQNASWSYYDYFIESSYKAGTGKNYKCYLVTEKGCEFIALKLTSKKGTLFTAAYVDKFHEMKKNQQQEQKFKPVKKPAEKNNVTGKRLRKLREKKGWSIIEFGKKIGMKTSHVQSLENGDRYPNKNTIMKYMQAFNLPNSFMSEFYNVAQLENQPAENALRQKLSPKMKSYIRNKDIIYEQQQTISELQKYIIELQREALSHLKQQIQNK